MEIRYSKKAEKDIEFWVKSGNKNIIKKISALIKDIQVHPFEGIGKPEPLKHHLKGYYSRRITEEHRLVYQVTESAINIISCKDHYTSL